MNELLVDNNLIDAEVEASQAIEELQKICEPECAKVICSSTALESTISTYENKLIDTIIQDAVIRNINELPQLVRTSTAPSLPILSVPVEVPANIREIIKQNVADGCKNRDSTEEIVKKIRVQVPRESLKQIQVVSEATSEVVKQRGTIQEEASTNALQTSTGVEIRSRNSKCYVYHLRRTSALIAGRVDGLQGDDTVVETKTRRRFWKTPPEYDIIQLRCYMKLTNRRAGILNECFPDGSNRATKIEWSDSIWDEIESQLADTVKEIRNISIG